MFWTKTKTSNNNVDYVLGNERGGDILQPFWKRAFKQPPERSFLWVVDRVDHCVDHGVVQGELGDSVFLELGNEKCTARIA